MKKKIENFLYYHKALLILAVVILAAGGYMLYQQRSLPGADYSVGVVSPVPLRQEETEAIRRALAGIGEDVNGDGACTVDLRAYTVALGEAGQDSAQIGALDADLVGKVSGLFFLTDPAAFEKATGGLCSAADAIPMDALPVLRGMAEQELFLVQRQDLEGTEKYAAMLQALAAGFSAEGSAEVD